MEKDEALAWLKRHGTKQIKDGMARYGIHTKLEVYGVGVGTMKAFGKKLGKDHALAEALWKSGVYEGQMLAVFVEDPERVTRRQMNSWAGDFDNWGICDTACFHLFDKTPFAWEKAQQWATSPREFVKRSAFALMASLVVHDKAAQDSRFLTLLPLIERGAQDDRNFVKKAVNWSLRCIGKRSRELNAAAIAVSKRLAENEQAAPRWVGKDAFRELSSAKVQQRLAHRAK